MKRMVLKVVLPIIILIAGFAGMKMMVLSKTPPQKQVRPPLGVLVETQTVQYENHPIYVRATGTVQSRKTAEIMPQVNGKVVYIASDFIAGGFFKKGELFFEIESTDYQLAVEKSRSDIAKAEYDLALVESQARVSRMEWERIDLKNKPKPNALVLYEPQLKNARAALTAAKADLKQRLLDLRRTKVYAPFNCRIRSETIDFGQYVSAGKSVAEISGTDIAEVVVPVPLEALQWLSVPQNKSDNSSKATVNIKVGGRIYCWQGRINRSLGEVDPKGRMIRLVVTVDDPFGLKLTADRNHFDLVDGLFVDVKIEGKTIKNVIAIPTGALRENSTVWIMNAEKRLAIQKVTVIHREKEVLLVQDGLKADEQLVLTRLVGAYEGMKLRMKEER